MGYGMSLRNNYIKCLLVTLLAVLLVFSLKTSGQIFAAAEPRGTRQESSISIASSDVVSVAMSNLPSGTQSRNSLNGRPPSWVVDGGAVVVPAGQDWVEFTVRLDWGDMAQRPLQTVGLITEAAVGTVRIPNSPNESRLGEGVPGTIYHNTISFDGNIRTQHDVAWMNGFEGETTVIVRKYIEPGTIPNAGDEIRIDLARPAQFETPLTWSHVVIERAAEETQPPTFNVTYSFVSETESEELPDVVKDLAPARRTGIADATVVAPTALVSTEIDVDDGIWTFAGWNYTAHTIAGADFNFVGTWTFDEFDNGGGNGSGSSGGSNWVISKAADTSSGGHIIVGSTVTYTIYAHNNGNETAANVLIEDTVPEGMSFIPGSAVTRVNGAINDAITPIVSSRTLSWIIPSVAPGQSVEVLFRVTVDQMPEGTYEMVYRNVATVNRLRTNPVYLTARRLFKGPDRMQVSVGETINWTLVGFHNPTDEEVAEFTIVDMPGLGLNFQSARLPAFNNGEGITYDIMYRVAGGSGWNTHTTNVDASRPFAFSLPQPGDLHYTEIGLFFGDVPVEFGLGDEIIMTFIVGNNAPGNMLINRFFLRYDYIEIMGGIRLPPIVIQPIVPGMPGYDDDDYYDIPYGYETDWWYLDEYGYWRFIPATDWQDLETGQIVYGAAGEDQISSGGAAGGILGRIIPQTGDGFGLAGIILSAAGLLLSLGGLLLLIRKSRKKNEA